MPKIDDFLQRLIDDFALVIAKAHAKCRRLKRLLDDLQAGWRQLYESSTNVVGVDATFRPAGATTATAAPSFGQRTSRIS